MSARTALRQPVRSYAVPSFAPSSASPFAVFDRDLKRAQRDRAARHVERSRLTDYVKDDVAQSMVDRLLVSSPFVSLAPPSVIEASTLVGAGFDANAELESSTDAVPSRLQDIKRRYPLVLDVGSGPGYLARHLDQDITQKVIMVDSSSASYPEVVCTYQADRSVRSTEEMLYRDEDIETEGQRLPCSVPQCRARLKRYYTGWWPPADIP